MSATPMLYNRKPADNFEAMQFTGDNMAAVEAWVRSHGGKSCPALEHPSTARLLIIQTPDGSREVRVGDYIARISSDFYLLPEHIFVETYEPVSVVPAEDQTKPRVGALALAPDWDDKTNNVVIERVDANGCQVTNSQGQSWWVGMNRIEALVDDEAGA